MDKKLTFEYILLCLTSKYVEKHSFSCYKEFEEDNDFNILKIMKLHFLVCSLNDDLLDLFDDWEALPYGISSKEIYENINNLEHFETGKVSLKVSKYFDLSKLDRSIRQKVDTAIFELLDRNPDILDYLAFELVEIHHKWLSYRLIFKNARENDEYRKMIPTRLIKKDLKYFK